jgi:ABC-type phosphate transport system permease subunit
MNGTAIIMCAVCFSTADPVVRDSLNAGIVVLLGVTAVVLGCFASFFVRLAQRSRASAHLVQERPAGHEAAGAVTEVAG